MSNCIFLNTKKIFLAKYLFLILSNMVEKCNKQFGLFVRFVYSSSDFRKYFRITMKFYAFEVYYRIFRTKSLLSSYYSKLTGSFKRTSLGLQKKIIFSAFYIISNIKTLRYIIQKDSDIHSPQSRISNKHSLFRWLSTEKCFKKSIFKNIF